MPVLQRWLKNKIFLPGSGRPIRLQRIASDAAGASDAARRERRANRRSAHRKRLSVTAGVALMCDEPEARALWNNCIVPLLPARERGADMIDLGGDVTGDGISKMVFTILAAVAEGERDRIRDAKRHLAAQGVFGGGRRPFGFDIVQDGDVQRMVPNATEQAVIERMKSMRANGATYRDIGGEVGMHGRTVQRILDRT